MENPMLHANLMVLIFMESELLPIIAGIGIFDLFGSCDLDHAKNGKFVRRQNLKAYYFKILFISGS